MLEGLAARLAAMNIREPGARERVRHALASPACQPPFDGGPGYMDHNADFHQLLVDIARNRLLDRQIRDLRLNIFRLQFHMALTAEAIAESAAGHKEIAEAVLAGDADGSEAAMRAHVQASFKAIAAVADNYFGAPHS